MTPMHLDRLSVLRVARCWLFVWLAGLNPALADQPKRPLGEVDPRDQFGPLAPAVLLQAGGTEMTGWSSSQVRTFFKTGKAP